MKQEQIASLCEMLRLWGMRNLKQGLRFANFGGDVSGTRWCLRTYYRLKEVRADLEAANQKLLEASDADKIRAMDSVVSAATIAKDRLREEGFEV